MKKMQVDQDLSSFRAAASRLRQSLERTLEGEKCGQLPEPGELSTTITEVESLLQRLRAVESQSAPCPSRKSVSAAESATSGQPIDRQFLESITDGVIVIDRDLRLTYVNAAAAKSSDSPPHELIGMDMEDAFPAEIDSALRTQILRVIETRSPIQFEIQSNVRENWYLVNVYPTENGAVIIRVDNTFRKVAEAEREWFLSENKRQKAILKAIFEADPSGLAVLTGPNLTFAYYNPAYRYLTPDPMVDPTDQPYEAIWPEGSEYSLKQDIESTLSTGKPYLQSGIERCMSDGSIRYFMVQLRRIIWDRETAVLMILWDITDIKQAENSLRESEARFRLAVEGIAEEMWVCDNHGLVSLVNLTPTTTMGLPEFKNKPIAEVLEMIEVLDSNGEPRPASRLPLIRSLHGEALNGEEVMRHRQSGVTRMRMFRSAPVRGSNGEVNGSVYIAWDITERKKAEFDLLIAHQEAVNEKNRLEAVLEALPVGLAIMDARGGDIRSNLRFEQIWKGPRPVPRSISDFALYKAWWADTGLPLQPDEWASARAVRNAETVIGQVLRIQRFDGSYGYILNSAAPILNALGHMAGCAVAIQDITDQRDAAQVLRAAKEEAEHNLVRMQIIVNSIKDGLLVVDSEGQILLSNEALNRMAGLESTPVGSYEVYSDRVELIDPSGVKIDPGQWPLAHALQGEIVLDEAASIRCIQTGEIHTVLVNAIPVLASDGQVEMVIVNIRDSSGIQQIEDRLQANQTQIEALLESTPCGFYVLDRNWIITGANRRTVDITGINFKGQIGHSFWKVQPQWLGTSYEVHLRQVMEQRIPAHFVLPGFDSDLWYEISIYPIDGQGITVLFNERTEEQKVAQALLDSEKRYRRLVENAYEGIWTVNANGVTDFINRYGARTLGYPLEEILGLPVSDFVFLEDRETILQRLENHDQQSEAPFDLRLRHKDGHEVWSSVRVSPILDDQGLFTGNLILFHDSTERRRAEQALRESEERERRRAGELEALMDSVPAMIWIARDSQAREMIGNRYGYEVVRMWEGANISKSAPEEDLAKQPYRNFKDGKEIPTEELPMQIAAATGVASRDYEFDLVFDDGSKITVFGNVIPIRDSSGKPSGAVAVFMDVTAVRRAEAVAREQLARLEVQHRLIDQREQERLQIARDLHDGPLQELIAATYSFRETAALVEDETLSASFAKIGASLHKLIDDLRSAASSLRPPALTRFGLGMAIRMHAAEYSEKYPDIQMSLEVQPLEIPIPESIRLAVFRIYQEALTNIAKHAQASRVSVQISRENQTIVLKISDNGIGFVPPLELGELAVRGHLGLVGMRERVEAVGGSIKISSQPGQGTTLEAQIPFPDEPRAGTER